MGQFSAAMHDYNSALRFAPKLASALYGRGIAKFKLGDTDGSHSDISAARKIDAGIDQAFDRYGVPVKGQVNRDGTVLQVLTRP
ncbi:tetratricopeptide repeat protein [Bradyrhizobium ottawaense]